MNLTKLAYKNLVSKPLNALLSLLLLVLSIALVTFMLQLSGQVGKNLDRNIRPVDMVVGAKGSPLQLVLSSVLHIDAPTGNIALQEAEALAKNPLIAKAVPVSYGDNYKGHRILGTDTTYLGLYGATLASGSLFQEPLEVVLGDRAYQQLQLEIGDTFVSSHGLAENAMDAHDGHPFVVKGILKPTGTVVDQLIVTPLESIWEVHEHEGESLGHVKEKLDEHEGESADHAEEGPDEHESGEDHREITAMLIKFRNPLGLVQLPRFINENTNMQAALPNFEIQRLLGLLGTGVRTVNAIALAILLVSGLSIFIGLLKAVRERRQELALLRTYGATTLQLLWTVLLEGLFLAVSGFFMGWVLGRLGLWGLSGHTRSAYGYDLTMPMPTATEALLFVCIVLITVLAVFLASLSIFKLNISKILSDE
ncbi:ABC transporter permease [Pricia sp.]|uniref:ABC transporter permease n=1 Tax=Pricia sp. TaxID=2268138 RepID=UPI00359344AB